MLLESKVAIVYGAGGQIGSGIARAFAREGARVFLAGRTLASLEDVAEQISGAGGVAESAQVDALDEEAVERHADAVVEKAGGIDVSVNAIAIRGELQGTPLIEISQEDYEAPIATGTTANFLTARAAARRMVKQGSGTILLLTATATWSQPALLAPISMGGFGVACAAIEGLSRSLAGELGPQGIRVICLRSEGTAELLASLKRPDLDGVIESQTLLRRAPTVADIANVAAFMASDQAGAMTATVANLSGGSVVD
jgi:NAD(P)-dependent dehydrogenase (short-subunit alcohol dehydrogenase family)